MKRPSSFADRLLAHHHPRRPDEPGVTLPPLTAEAVLEAAKAFDAAYKGRARWPPVRVLTAREHEQLRRLNEEI